ncbi:immunoglobulin variable region used by the ITC63B heavy chain [Diaporthe amygdali]|uniref:immunoglobulin variable region used by the ITC63B heavy chain n=1 Tax=Phomopsis amygdali TaxID=1214568 RepID=UPI0022FDD9F3|nr:immunoglobulin variable region used by the ITC63B heavy chain [Diaporthe amygdali]KAJ0120014.1 immunoglobulin variable region used by the ITC63B heavy chain [Diaporthe amygdali]
MVAWAYILSARWAELIPGADISDYNSHQAQLNSGNGPHGLGDDDNSVVVDIGDVDVAAARWWTAVLAADGGWDASIRSDTGVLLCSPWSIRTQPGPNFTISANIQPCSAMKNSSPASFSTALRYLSEYCHLHDLAEQSQAALAAALLIPVAKFDTRRIKLPVPRLPRKTTRSQQKPQVLPSWDMKPRQLDRLLTLSCNARGVKALLNSIFFEPDVACNSCGAWLQGSFAFLDSDKAGDPHVLLSTFMERDPGLGFLWLGAFITGAEERCLQEARMGWWKVDISAAAWTADECRLMYLSHNPDHAVPPLFPFAPFGSTAMEDTDLDVRRHARCSAAHGLKHSCFTWDCQGGKKVEQNETLANAIRAKAGKPSVAGDNSFAVVYDSLDPEDEVSEMVTRNVFTWLRGEDGFPVAERSIREHEWIENLESDDDSPIDGDVLSTAGRNLRKEKGIFQNASSVVKNAYEPRLF